MATEFSSSNTSVCTKRALIIGNNEYRENSPLRYCINDAEDLADKLRRISFEITVGTNLTYEQMNTMIETFNDKINEGDLILFFFAGHGCQWNHLNFLIPIDDDRITTGADLEDRAVNVQDTLEKIMCRHPSAAIFLLDCCRNSFVSESLNSNGLSPMQVVAGSFISFACDANKVAADESRNGRNSLFTSHLLRHIDQPYLTIDDIMCEVCDGVMKETNGNQCPFRVSSVQGKVYLNQQFTAGQSILFIHANINAKWKQHGITVAGGNGYGNQLSQLYFPWSIYVDDDHRTIYTADWKNDRIVEWECGAQSGEVVAGGNGYGNRSDQFNYPSDVIVDKKNDSLIICDYGNRRVVRWSRQNGTNGETVISDIDCSRLTMDNNGDLYVSDCVKNEVRRWKQGETEGTIVAGGNGEGNRLNQLYRPAYIFVDEDHSVYVSDCLNRRVMKWMKGAEEGIVVAGGNGQGSSLTQLSCPTGVIVDHLGNVYVADKNNHRILRWYEGYCAGSIVVGGNGEGEQPNQFRGPSGLSFDVEGNLYVVDQGNKRIQKFDIDSKFNLYEDRSEVASHISEDDMSMQCREKPLVFKEQNQLTNNPHIGEANNTMVLVEQSPTYKRQYNNRPTIHIIDLELPPIDWDLYMVRMEKYNMNSHLTDVIRDLNPTIPLYILVSMPPSDVLHYYYLQTSSNEHANINLNVNDRITNINSIDQFASKLYEDLGQYYRNEAETALFDDEYRDRDVAKQLLTKSIKCFEILGLYIEKTF
ncbi:unnamed protein product [Adineta steineri]|uniref:Caspase family p20 domain-containing protein n=1 Tax=Adineta steineri TaxID=433720 RepID=A0A814UFD1_9BILA|nr:unnamed protein product [Adineta steineri]CAF1171516.1 unnamed protein product [Adineta steineri]CAF1172843.1 unnamed protein product [Adineta steineri]